MRRGPAILAVGVLAVLATAAAAWSASAPRGPDPAVEEWPAWPYSTQCELGLPFDPVTAFSGRAEAERGSRPSEVALREFLRRDSLRRDSLVRSMSRWRLLAEDEDQAEFVHGPLSGKLEWLRFEREAEGWRFSGSSSDCDPTSIVGGGPVVTWTLAESILDSNAALQKVAVDLGPGPCSGGSPQNPRARLVFRNWGRKLLMTVWLKPLPEGSYMCPGVFEPPLKVTLPRKIKLSRLYDGSTYPPTPAIDRDRAS